MHIVIRFARRLHNRFEQWKSKERTAMGSGAATRFNSIGIFLRPHCNAEEAIPTIAPRDIFIAAPELYLGIYHRGNLHRKQREFSCNERLANEK